MRSGSRFAAAAALLAAVLGCAPRQPAARDRAPAAVDSLLRAALSDRMRQNSYWAHLAGMAADSMHVRRVASRVVPGLVYSHGSFAPPRTSHVGPFTAAVVSRPGAARVLSGPADWDSVARFAPRDSATAAAACAELVDNIPVRGSWGRIYNDSALLYLPYDILPPGSPLPRAAESARGAGRSWTATVWWITSGRTIQQRCLFRDPGEPRSRTRLLRVDSIPVGFLYL
ncbi:hypothetical protein [Longimicrobium terrae]|uniref:Uncharacterized protein n=1 Tax=Longimicrobium terrae TaxID=1639882 RepID=A0A841GVC0_9BACT|nr:hypothetical protein [Longimicrobium terrae]MBB4634415.1 hypothetical protein [Longimicrobium terrae]MBB6068695.1 hypothetical protein [Longimicrobium terrae]